ncbi:MULTISPECIES: cytidylyltransferase domain-containing protein [unclassified Halobacteriovorax]|uniref:cytidylyltransferase domain-containing protein n=1 Tax=unclassified Halobacteriovorax TaxID=2639665 RepID=UPI00399AE2C4
MLNGKRIVIILQARLSSSRLPNKVLLPIGANFVPMLRILTESILLLDCVDSCYVAIPNNEESKLLSNNIASSVNIFKGDLYNVFSRFYSICENEEESIVIRMTADNPIIIEDLFSEAVCKHIESENDYTYTEGLPLGCNFEIFNASSMLKIEMNDLTASELEHVTLHFKNSDKFKTGTIKFETSIKDYRLTLDEFSDYCFVQALSNKIELGLVNYKNLEQILLENVYLKNINTHVVQKVCN